MTHYFVPLFIWFLIAPPLAAGPLEEVGCARLLEGLPEIKLLANGRTLSITSIASDTDMGLVVYTLEYVLKNLGLEREELADVFGGKDVLLVGEGFGELLPALLAAGARVTSVDPLYAIDPRNVARDRISPSELVMLQSIEKYFEDFRPHLIPGIAQRLPVADASYDIYLSHMVWNNFNLSDQSYKKDAIVSAMDEALRVLRPGGEVISAMAWHPPGNVFISNHLTAVRADGKLSEFSVTRARPSIPKYVTGNGPRVVNAAPDVYSIFRVMIDR